MTKIGQELTDEFDAESEDGQRFHLLVYTDMIDAKSMSTPNAPPLEGFKDIRTSDGYPCNCIDDDNYEIVKLGRLLKVRRV